MFNELRIKIIKTLIDLNESLIFERRLNNFYKHHDINCAIDIGANKGQTIDFILRINAECEIYAIEPNPNLFNYLNFKYKKFPNVKIYNIGISNKSGSKLFFENVFDYTSTFEELNMNSDYLIKKAKILGVTKENIVKKSYLVPVKTINDFIIDNFITNSIDLIKIDTEGHEFYCLEGLFISEAPKIKFIQIEYHEDDLYKNKINIEIINTLLNDHNYFEVKRIKHGFGNFYEMIYSFKNKI